ncbi:MAG: hypothetical protein LBF58_09270 [Deltaproteobacteria bacterium]|jgi:hypothetical protein|nr:hypothetical protein [Deltaproteobacteria bacterium]
MRFKSLAASALTILLFFYLTSPLLAQDNTVKANDVDIFIRMVNLKKGDSRGAAQLFVDSDRSWASFKAVLEKIVTMGVIFHYTVSDDVARVILSDEGITPAEFDIVKRRHDEVLAAYRKLTGQ